MPRANLAAPTKTVCSSWKGQYTWAESLVQRVTGELNKALPVGQDLWKPHQVQAAAWSSVRTRMNDSVLKDRVNEESVKKGFQRGVENRPFVVHARRHPLTLRA